jgi:hypothetical protein
MTFRDQMLARRPFPHDAQASYDATCKIGVHLELADITVDNVCALVLEHTPHVRELVLHIDTVINDNLDKTCESLQEVVKSVTLLMHGTVEASRRVFGIYDFQRGKSEVTIYMYGFKEVHDKALEDRVNQWSKRVNDNIFDELYKPTLTVIH